MTSPTWNPRYVAFAVATGMTPAARLAADRARHTGRMMEFILWIGQRWTEWGGPRPSSRSRADHDNFDAWLQARYLRGQQMELEFSQC